MLEPIGLSPTLEAIYRTMLRHRDWNTERIAEHLHLSVAETKSGLDDLAQLMLLAPAESADREFRPVNPALGLTTLLAHAEEEVERRQRQIFAARSAMAVLAAEAAEGASREGFVRLDGIDAVRERMEQIAVSVHVECISMNPVAAQSPTAKKASKPLNQLLLERGVSVRSIYQQSFSNDADLVDYAEWLTGLGGELRTVPIVPTLMIIYDRKGVLVPIDPAATHLGAIDVTGPGVVALATALFEQMWQSAVPFGAAVPRDQEGLNPTERQLLSLLSAGHTDQVVARRLGVSLSTVRRMMAGLMGRLSARSRFQAGVKAAERGWLCY
ncbi:helix-turn-helix transcriptional regulator [Micromonospora sp. SD19]